MFFHGEIRISKEHICICLPTQIWLKSNVLVHWILQNYDMSSLLVTYHNLNEFSVQNQWTQSLPMLNPLGSNTLVQWIRQNYDTCSLTATYHNLNEFNVQNQWAQYLPLLKKELLYYTQKINLKMWKKKWMTSDNQRETDNSNHGTNSLKAKSNLEIFSFLGSKLELKPYYISLILTNCMN